MPDLTDAIKELQPSGPWTPGNFTDRIPFSEDRATSIATILSAVLSGDLIPLAHHNAMIGAIVEKAAGEITAQMDALSGPESTNGQVGALWNAMSSIRALTPADARAALDEAISRAREVKPLVWVSGWFCDQDAFYADTAIGNWAVVQYSSRNGRWAYDDPSGETSDEDWESASLAQQAVQIEHTARIHAALAPVEGAKA